MSWHGTKVLGRLLGGKKLYLVVILVAILALFIPIRWTGPTERICQALLAPSGRCAMLAARAVSPGQDRQSRSGQQRVADDDQWLRMLSAANVHIAKLEDENYRLSMLRQRIEPTFSLLPANVVGFDSLGLRSVVIDRGSFSGVEAGSAVLVGLAEPIAGLADVDPKIALASGALLGRIAYSPGPYTARIKLVTHSGQTFPVYIISADPDDSYRDRILTKVPRAAQGTGRDELSIAMVPTKYNVRTGDVVVLAQPEEFKLPISLAVGRVSQVNPRTDSSEVVDVVATPYFSIYQIDRLYVLTESSSQL